MINKIWLKKNKTGVVVGGIVGIIFYFMELNLFKTDWHFIERIIPANGEMVFVLLYWLIYIIIGSILGGLIYSKFKR